MTCLLRTTLLTCAFALLGAIGCTNDDGSCERTSECADSESCVGGRCLTACTFLNSCTSSDELCYEEQCVRSLPADECAVWCPDEEVCLDGGLCCEVGGTSLRCAPGCDQPECQDCVDGACCGNGTCDFEMGERFEDCPDECRATCDTNADCADPTPYCVLVDGPPERGECADECTGGSRGCWGGGVCSNNVCLPRTDGDACMVTCDAGEFCVDGVRCCSTDLGSVSCSFGCDTTADCEARLPGSSCIGEAAPGSFRPSCRTMCDRIRPCFAEGEECLDESCVVTTAPATCAPACNPSQLCVDGTRCCDVVDGVLVCT